MSTSRRRRSNTGTAWSTPRWMRRASSKPEMTSTSTPASSRARRRSRRGSRPRAPRWWRRHAREPGAASATRAFAERGDAPLDRVGVKPFHVAGARAESHHLLHLLEDLDPAGVAHAGDDEMDRVGADVDGRKHVVGHPPTLPPRSGGRAHAANVGRDGPTQEERRTHHAQGWGVPPGHRRRRAATRRRSPSR